MNLPQWARRAGLQLYRALALAAIASTLRFHHVRVQTEGDTPITLGEIKPIYPEAAALWPDASERRGLWVKDGRGRNLGYVLSTLPDAAKLIGYRGWTDTLVAFDPALHVIGVKLRSSQDTREHVEDVRDDRYFMKTWNGKSWDEIARIAPEKAGIDGVSGATITSMTLADGIQQRLAASDAAAAAQLPQLRVRWRDAGLATIVAAALVFSFAGVRGRPWLRRGFQALVIGYVGFFTGDLLAQSVFAGWAQSGAPWRAAPGLVLLAAAAMAVPWATGKPMYCHQLCPHGAAQEWIHGLAPKRWRLQLPKDFAAGLRWLPACLLAMVLVIAIFGLRIDLAHLEPFDAYLVKTAGWLTVAIALVGLAASAFVPMAYCRYGCPTGALLNFVRSHGTADRFGRRDLAALVLLGLAWLLVWKYRVIHFWMVNA